MKNCNTYILFFLLAFLAACSEEEATVSNIQILSITANGASLKDGTNNIPVETTIEVVFDSSLDPALFERNFSLTLDNQSVAYDLVFANASSRAIVTVSLAYNSSYQLKLSSEPIGAMGQVLENQLTISFTTAEDEIIRELPPCTSGGACLETMSIPIGNEVGQFDFYANYPIFEESAQWEKLKQAIIVVHGVNRNADDYFSYLTTTLSGEELDESTVLIAPYFKGNADAANELYWNTSGWREGQASSGNMQISSFAIIDSLILQLADSKHFPVLEKIIVTGHSSGGLFSHVYAGANQVEDGLINIEIQHIPSNSQYYYYPNGQRYDEATNQFYEPTDCAVYDFWPMGFQSPPNYLSQTNVSTFNAQFADRKINYLIGNGTGSDGSLNTNDCEATLLGSTRFKRGQHIFQLINEYYAGHAHQQTVVQGIGHDGQGMYQSSEFKNLLSQLLD